jgi:carbon storage regulator
MLVLSRKPNESILIADNIRITVASIRGHHVRIGIEAPNCIPVVREELIKPASAA